MTIRVFQGAPEAFGTGTLLRLAGMLAFIVVQSACTHTTLIQPGQNSRSLFDAQRSVSGRVLRVQPVSGEVVRIVDTVLTPDSISGLLESGPERFNQALTNVAHFKYRSRSRGVWDWTRLGVIAGIVATPILLEGECDGCGAYALLLAPVGAAVGAVYGVILGAALGSTIRFEISPRW